MDRFDEPGEELMDLIQARGFFVDLILFAKVCYWLLMRYRRYCSNRFGCCGIPGLRSESFGTRYVLDLRSDIQVCLICSKI